MPCPKYASHYVKGKCENNFINQNMAIEKYCVFLGFELFEVNYHVLRELLFKKVRTALILQKLIRILQSNRPNFF